MTKRKEEVLPTGFFDDPLADAKARKINIKEEVAKAQEKEWKEFQNFVAAVETEENSTIQTTEDEAIENEAVEKLEQMQYLNRVRKTLLMVTQVDVDLNDEETAQLQLSDDADEIVTKALKKRAHDEKKKKEIDENDDLDDLLDWRARRH